MGHVHVEKIWHLIYLILISHLIDMVVEVAVSKSHQCRRKKIREDKESIAHKIGVSLLSHVFIINRAHKRI